jgi:hypothetical protein
MYDPKDTDYSRARLQAVAIDISLAYVSTIFKNLPETTIIAHLPPPII